MLAPAYRLEGLQLDGEWTVGPRVDLGADATGGNFSCCYNVTRRDGAKAFLKALDFSRALAAPDPARAFEALTVAYNFERDLLTMCANRRMDRVVRAVGDGKVNVENRPEMVVQYLIFEFADCDLRKQLALMGNVETAWKLRALHHMATGLMQLHRSDIAHQDLKPSNVLVFGGAESKVSDLGCASLKNASGPRDDREVAGDPGYAPPEILYGFISPEWSFRRIGCDLYLLGSMVVFLFTGLSMTSLICGYVSAGHRWSEWRGTYSDVLPYVRDAFGQAVPTFATQIGDDTLRSSLVEVLRQLCDPDPSQRGHPINRALRGDPLSLERYVAQFDLLARRAEIGRIK